MLLNKIYEEGEDIGLHFEIGDKFWVRRRFSNKYPGLGYCEVVEKAGRLFLSTIPHPELVE